MKQIARQLLFGAVVFLLILNEPVSAWASLAEEALDSLSRLKALSECCVTRVGYLRAHKEAAKKVEGFLRSRHVEAFPDLAGAIRKVWEHYEDVARIYKRHAAGLICEKTLLSQIKSKYPSADRDFDQGGAMMLSTAGRRCMAPQLVVPIILRRAAEALKKAQGEFFKHKGQNNQFRSESGRPEVFPPGLKQGGQ